MHQEWPLWQYSSVFIQLNFSAKLYYSLNLQDSICIYKPLKVKKLTSVNAPFLYSPAIQIVQHNKVIKTAISL